MKDKNLHSGKRRQKKGGYNGDRIWRTHRLEGIVRNRGIRPIRKKPH